MACESTSGLPQVGRCCSAPEPFNSRAIFVIIYKLEPYDFGEALAEAKTILDTLSFSDVPLGKTFLRLKDRDGIITDRTEDTILQTTDTIGGISATNWAISSKITRSTARTTGVTLGKMRISGPAYSLCVSQINNFENVKTREGLCGRQIVPFNLEPGFPDTPSEFRDSEVVYHTYTNPAESQIECCNQAP